MEQALLSWLGGLASIRTEILWLVGAGLSGLLTIHILLRKREVGAAIGWIGLVWLSPLFGSALYAFFGINRVTRRAQKLRIKPSQPNPADGDRAPAGPALPARFRPLDHAVRRITALPLQAGNCIEPLRNGDAVYPAMLEAIAGATRSVALSSYIFRKDGIGRDFLDALQAAQGRGVAVRVLVDGVGSGYFIDAIYRGLRRRGLPSGRFMHTVLPWRMPFLNLRTHKKLLIVDGTLAFTGGINIADENRVALNPPEPVRDVHFRIRGPVVAQLTAAFAADWAFVMDEEIEGPDWFPALEPQGGTQARVVTSGPDADLRKIELVVLEAISCAERSIRLMTPYFLPSEVLVSALSLAALRGITVDVIIPMASDHAVVDWATRAHVDPLLASDVRIWLDDPPFDHAKLLVVDDAWCFIGSANWDTRSFRLNFELNVEVYDTDLAGRLDAFMREKMTLRLTRETLAQRGLPVRLRDAGVRLLLPYL
ncbi:phospholipase D-like domain-containing protein [Methylobacterium sp. J-078]|uniref:phospholipase D-like domain-containing protein n=1 Tax=Methylobacterium sp. J-078 TaxID=2836657 RepID=UPI001FB8B6FC|nr:phospholipase D-like domain-containing protein [Methylobacterium sp. J-078]MCJ2046427.1 phospholipase D-like domain-containing protein [Methylobacterium sp. J-078]